VIEIKDRYTGKAIWSGGATTVKAAVEACYRSGTPLRFAYLTGADLTGAYLKGADLTGAYLTGAYLTGAYLTGADLTGADLTGAYLTGADLKGAYLTGAYLTNESFKDYLEQVVPALLTAGGKTVAEVVASGAWDCHEWSNCPMAFALGIKNEAEAPILLRPRVKEFIQLFDARLIPKPEIAATGDAVTP